MTLLSPHSSQKIEHTSWIASTKNLRLDFNCNCIVERKVMSHTDGLGYQTGQASKTDIISSSTNANTEPILNQTLSKIAQSYEYGS